MQIVSAKFVDNFNGGWSKLNKLSGTYLTGDDLKDDLKDDLQVAAAQIEDIAFSRRQAATAKLDELNQYRDRIRAKA